MLLRVLDSRETREPTLRGLIHGAQATVPQCNFLVVSRRFFLSFSGFVRPAGCVHLSAAHLAPPVSVGSILEIALQTTVFSSTNKFPHCPPSSRKRRLTPVFARCSCQLLLWLPPLRRSCAISCQFLSLSIHSLYCPSSCPFFFAAAVSTSASRAVSAYCISGSPSSRGLPFMIFSTLSCLPSEHWYRARCPFERQSAVASTLLGPFPSFIHFVGCASDTHLHFT
ncbi:hypothetical protein TRVL_07188 [Trypanosoma vivax]|nr:hypothetical protein TRVL_07188 [Trypanosoma vivax]